MVIILDDVLDLNTSFQNDIIDINFGVTWYSLDDNHLFKDFCLQMINKVNDYINLTSCIGYECWTQNNTRPSTQHQDKDEELFERTGKLSFPLCSIIYYPIVKNLKGGQLHLEDDIITPKTDRLVIFPPGKFHTVKPFKGKRVSLLVNPWNRSLNKTT